MSEKKIDMSRAFEDCGCGKPARYSVLIDNVHVGACNKYRRCSNYEDLRKSNQALVQIINAYHRKRNVDGLNGRKWDASKHFEAEAQIEKLTEIIKPFIYPDNL